MCTEFKPSATGLTVGALSLASNIVNLRQLRIIARRKCHRNDKLNAILRVSVGSMEEVANVWSFAYGHPWQGCHDIDNCPVWQGLARTDMGERWGHRLVWCLKGYHKEVPGSPRVCQVMPCMGARMWQIAFMAPYAYGHEHGTLQSDCIQHTNGASRHDSQAEGVSCAHSHRGYVQDLSLA